MKNVTVALALSCAAICSQAACFGSGAMQTCTDNQGNSYNVQRFGNTTTMQGSNVANGTTSSVPPSRVTSWALATARRGTRPATRWATPPTRTAPHPTVKAGMAQPPVCRGCRFSKAPTAGATSTTGHARLQGATDALACCDCSGRPRRLCGCHHGRGASWG